MRRPVQKIGAIAMMLAGMMGAGAQAQGNSSIQGTEMRKERIGTRKEAKRMLPGMNSWRLRLSPAAPGNQRQLRKKWRLAPHTRPHVNRK